MEQSKNKRARRTRAELEADVFDAIRQLASEKGSGANYLYRYYAKSRHTNVRPAQ